MVSFMPGRNENMIKKGVGMAKRKGVDGIGKERDEKEEERYGMI